MLTKILLTSVLLILVKYSLSSRILGIVPAPSYSHQIVFHPIWKALAKRGHEVTLMTVSPINDPSLTTLREINMQFSYGISKSRNIMKSSIETNPYNFVGFFKSVFEMGHILIDQQLQIPEVQSLIKNESEHFDLVMTELIFPTMAAFAERFDCPFIGMLSLDAVDYVYDLVGSPTHPVLYPGYYIPAGYKLTFFQRLVSTVSVLYLKVYTTWYINPWEDITIRKYFGEDFLDLNTILTKRICMLFVNANPVLHAPRPTVPSVVNIGGGIHMDKKTNKPLPKDLQTLLDGAKHGAIYFSLGTNVKAGDLAPEAINNILQTFSKLPYQILWKLDTELPNTPKNVLISKWFPQQDIFRHKNIKLFITQGGLQSAEESVYNRIPMIVVPYLADQHTNALRIVSSGFGKMLDSERLHTDDFKNAITEVMENPTYRTKVRETAEAAYDQPMDALDRAVWWTEYALRHKGAKHLRAPALDIPLYQYFLLDVLAVFLITILLVVFILYKLIQLLLAPLKYFKSPPSKAKKTKKQ